MDIKKIEALLNLSVRPQLLAHGGDMHIVSVDDGVLRFRLLGQCSGCPSANLATKDLIQQMVTENIPEILHVELIPSVSESLLQQARDILAGKVL